MQAPAEGKLLRHDGFLLLFATSEYEVVQSSNPQPESQELERKSDVEARWKTLRFKSLIIVRHFCLYISSQVFTRPQR